MHTFPIYAAGVHRFVHHTYLNIRVFNNMRVRGSNSIAVMRHARAAEVARDLSRARGDDVTSSGSPPTPLRPHSGREKNYLNSASSSFSSSYPPPPPPQLPCPLRRNSLQLQQLTAAATEYRRTYMYAV